MRDFAKIVASTDGRQVLFYVEPDGDEAILHQCLTFDGFMADAKIILVDDETAYQALELCDVARADRIISLIKEMVGES